MVKYKLSATIPVVQYGNLIPEIELEGEDKDALHEEAMSHIKKVWDRHGERPLTDRNGGGEELETFTGEKILYNGDTHEYFDLAGNKLLSGSAYAQIGEKPFDKASILPKTAKSWGVGEGELGEIWEINSRISNEYGSAVHTALELFLKHGLIGAKIASKKGQEENYAITSIPHLNGLVKEFWAKFEKEVGNGLAEVLVSDVANRMAGRIDLLEVLDPEAKVCRIGDYKTNSDLDDKKIAKYQKQLSFYGHILKNKGWNVTGLDIYHFSKEWNKIDLPLLDLAPF